MNLYKCELECKIKGFPDRVEYLRAMSDDILVDMFEQCENVEGSEYYGYRWTGVCLMKMEDFPEVKTMKVKTKRRKK
jgi:hypothetical protein